VGKKKVYTDDPVEQLALQLYDKRNPRPDKKINVSKAECIRQARQQLEK
jgi:hypothetical protein